MENTLLAATAHHSTIPSPLTIVIALAAVAYVLWGRTQGRPLKVRRMVLLPAVLVIIGITDLTGSSASHLNSKDIAFLVASVAISAVLGAARGATIELYPQGGELWQRYKRNTVLLWILLIASKLVLAGAASSAGASAGGGTNSLLLSLGVSLLAEAAIVGPRALSTGVPFATRRQGSDRRRYAPVTPSAPVASQIVSVDPTQEQPEHRQIGQVSLYAAQPYLRRSRGSRHQRPRSGPIHRLISQAIDAQAQSRAQQRSAQQADQPEGWDQ